MGRNFTYLIIGALFVVLLAFSWISCRQLKAFAYAIYRELSPAGGDRTPHDLRSGVIQFPDVNKLHLEAAHENGIAPMWDDDLSENPSEAAKLKEIKDNDLYRLKKMPHSLPYLTLKADSLLNGLAELFQKRLKAKGIPKHYFLVSSALRTKKSVLALRLFNPNASKNSAHLFATTFDITYKQFIDSIGNTDYNTKVRESLSESIAEFRNQDRCYVITENRELCFHITVR